MDIEYPSRGFARNAIAALKQGHSLTIHIRPGWRTDILRRELADLPACEREAMQPTASGKRFPSYKMAILMIPMTTVHFYALSGGFRMYPEIDKEVRVSYRPDET